MGTMTFGGKGGFAAVGSTDVAQARRQIDLALAAGVNVVDTADMCSDGLSEGPNDGGASRYHLVRSLERSLERLRTDHVDLYQIHEWDGQTPLEETLEALDTLVRSGKVRYVGASNHAGWQLMKALAVADAHGYQRYVSQQIHYTLQARDVVDALVEIGQGHGVSAAQVALAWLLGRPGVTSLVIGARTEEQLSDDLAAADLVLTGEERARLDAVSAVPLRYPHWHQAATAKDCLSPADLSLLGPHL